MSVLTSYRCQCNRQFLSQGSPKDFEMGNVYLVAVYFIYAVRCDQTILP